MKEPKAIRENEIRPGEIYYYWPDGTLRETTYKDFMETNISKCRVCYERLIFIIKTITRLVRHFKFIEVRKKTDGIGKRQYVTRWNPDGKAAFVKEPIPVRNIRLGDSFRNRQTDSECGAKSSQSLINGLK